MDNNEVLQLLGIVLQSKDYPALRNIHNEAMGQLDKIAADLAPKAAPIVPPPAPKVYEQNEDKPARGRF